MRISKPLFVQYLVGAIAICGLLTGCSKQIQTQQVPPIAVQLWSVKDPLHADFDGTIAQLAKMGFEGVELAGYFGPYKENTEGLLALLAKHQLSISSAHVPIDVLSPSNIHQTMKFYNQLGVNKLILPWDDRAFDEQRFNEFLLDMRRIQTTLTKHGFEFGFHNHEREFNDYKKSTFWDELALATNTDFILQLDIGWVTRAGKDPVTYIERYPNRMKLSHFKAKLHKPMEGKYPIIGQDTTDWLNVLKSSITDGGVEWIIIEQEEYPHQLTPLQAVNQSKIALDKLIVNHFN